MVKGPEFLYVPEVEWPQEVEIKETESMMNEFAKNPKEVTHTSTTTNPSNGCVELFSYANIGEIMNCDEYNSKNKLLELRINWFCELLEK